MIIVLANLYKILDKTIEFANITNKSVGDFKINLNFCNIIFKIC
jgi:hypothetical protein